MPVGSSGHPTCFSFYANKNLSTGEGGAVALFDGAMADRLRSLRQHGLSVDAWKRFTHPQNVLGLRVEEIGYKMNYTDLQASIGRVQLRRQPELAARRLALARRYCAVLAESAVPFAFQRGAFDPGHARHLLVIKLPIERMRASRNEVLLALRGRNIGASLHYQPLHTTAAYRAFARTRLPHTDDVAERILTLPISASMTIADVDYVTEQLLDVLAAGASAAMVA
jgi:dTDP-4-amino-4,6-dideoxygalactose transaminase